MYNVYTYTYILLMYIRMLLCVVNFSLKKIFLGKISPIFIPPNNDAIIVGGKKSIE